MSALTPKDLEGFRLKAKQEYPNFGSRQIKKLFAYLDEQIARAEKAERERSKLIDRIIPSDCPRGVVDCTERKPGACDKCWLEWAEQPGEGYSFEGAI